MSGVERNIWDPWIEREVAWGSPHQNAPADALYDALPKTGALDILQLASGTARDTRYLLSHPAVASITTVDSAPMATKMARDVVIVGLGGVEKRPQILEKRFELLTPDDIGQRDAIYAVAAFPFIERDDTNRLMPQMLQALKPGGRFVGNFSLENRSSPATGASVYAILASDADEWLADAKVQDLYVERRYYSEYAEPLEPGDPDALVMEFYATRKLG